MSSRLIPLTLALGGSIILSACVSQSDTPAPVVFRTSTPDTPGIVAASAQIPVAPINGLPVTDARGVADRGSYQVIVAGPGDSLIAMANRVGLTPSELSAYNGLPVGHLPNAGEELVLPPRPDRYASGITTSGSGWSPDLAAAAIDRATLPTIGTSASVTPAAIAQTSAATPLVHTVAPGETLFSIARLYNVPVTSIADWNSLGADYALNAGQRLEIPFGAVTTTQPAIPTLPQAPVTVVTADAQAILPGAASVLSAPPSSAAPLPENTTLAVETPASPNLGQFRSGSGIFTAPVDGPVLRAYAPNGAERNEGIDFSAPAGAPVRAAGDGEVVLVSRSVGDLDTIVMVRHPNNLVTVYGRITGVNVARGDSISQGQQLGVVADRTEPSVQFQVRRGMQHTNPAEYL